MSDFKIQEFLQELEARLQDVAESAGYDNIQCEFELDQNRVSVKMITESYKSETHVPGVLHSVPATEREDEDDGELCLGSAGMPGFEFEFGYSVNIGRQNRFAVGQEIPLLVIKRPYGPWIVEANPNRIAEWVFGLVVNPY